MRARNRRTYRGGEWKINSGYLEHLIFLSPLNILHGDFYFIIIQYVREYLKIEANLMCP